MTSDKSLSVRQARRLRRLVEQRLAAFEELVHGADGEPTAADLERQLKALTALMRAMEAAAGLESRARPQRRSDAKARLRRSLARRLEALLAQTAPPRPVGEAQRGGEEADR